MITETSLTNNMDTLKLSTKSWDDTFNLISGWDTKRVREARIMVVGAGALGHEVLKNLALLNVGHIVIVVFATGVDLQHIVIVDFDRIEYSNLSRSVLFREADSQKSRFKCEVAAERVREINPNVKVKPINGDIMLDVGLGVFNRMDAVIGCLDNRLARVFINRHCFKLGKPWVDGAIENLAGQLNVYQPDIGCYECQLTKLEESIIQYRLGCPDIAQRNASQGRIPTTPIAASMIGAMQAAEALKIVFQNKGESLAGKQLDFDVMQAFFMISKGDYEPKPDCVSHSAIPSIISAPITANSAVSETLEWLRRSLNDSEVEILLDYDVITMLASIKTEKSHSTLLPKPHFSDTIKHQFQESEDEEFRIEQSFSRIDHQFPYQDAPLSKLGIPPLHILTVCTSKEIAFVELSGDETFLGFQ